MCNALAVLIDLLAPRRCAGCDHVGQVLCHTCEDMLLALPLPPPVADGSGRIDAAFPFRGRARHLLHCGKYRGGRSLLSALAGLAGERLVPADPDEAVIAVPLGRRRRLERGYNQAEIVATRLAVAWARPTLSGLVRFRETAAQVGTDAEARWTNVAGSFRWEGGSLAGRRLVLVDDVVTTGATSRSASAVLSDAGAAEVRTVALARVI